MIKVRNNTPPYETVMLRIHDHDSNTRILQSILTIEEFTNMILNGSTFGKVKCELNIEKAGKVLEEKIVTFEVPNNVGKNINDYFADKFNLLKQDGWSFNTNDIGNPNFLAYEAEDYKAYTIKIYK